jgi:hypothetical protein
MHRNPVGHSHNYGTSIGTRIMNFILKIIILVNFDYVTNATSQVICTWKHFNNSYFFFHLALVAFKCFINVFDNTLLNDVH